MERKDSEAESKAEGREGEGGRYCVGRRYSLELRERDRERLSERASVCVILNVRARV